MTNACHSLERYAVAAALIAACLAAATGCATNHGMALVYGDGPNTPPVKTWITGYTTRDGRHHHWEGTVEPSGADSLLFVGDPIPERGSVYPEPGSQFKLAKTDVKTVQTPRTTTSKLAIAAIGALILGTTLIAGSAASGE